MNDKQFEAILWTGLLSAIAMGVLPLLLFGMTGSGLIAMQAAGWAGTAGLAVGCLIVGWVFGVRR